MDNVFYKLGALQAVNQITDQLVNAEYDNPTEAPPKFAAVKAVQQALEKMGEPRGRKATRKPASRSPSGSGSRFNALKRKLSRKKGNKVPFLRTTTKG
jgi:hypothetical protein